MAGIDQAEIRRLYKSMLDKGKSHAAMKKTRGALSPLFMRKLRAQDVSSVTEITADSLGHSRTWTQSCLIPCSSYRDRA